MTNKIKNTSIETLYEQDYPLWLEKTAQLLQQRKWSDLDIDNLVEEIEGLGIEQKRKLESYLRQLLLHLLLYCYWEQERDYCAKGWQDEIDNFRDELEILLRSKTLYNYLLQKFDDVYQKARKRAIRKTGLPPETFPVECPFSIDKVLNPDYLPN